VGLGHEPRILPAIYVKPFVKGQKNDYNDAEAIAEAACGRTCGLSRRRARINSTCRPCHRVRSRLVSRRTATINQIRALSDRARHRQDRPARPPQLALRDTGKPKSEISPRTAKLIRGLYEDWCCLDERIETVTGD
jgi:transposase